MLGSTAFIIEDVRVMSNEADDLEDLFDQISAQRSDLVTGAKVEEGIDTTSSTLLSSDQIDGVDTRPASDNPMFERLGSIVRQLHDSLKELGYDRSLSEMAGEISDSKGRLEYIASLTEQAANKVLNAIDESLPEQDKLNSTAKDIEARWLLMLEGKMSLNDFKRLASDSQEFSSFVAKTSEAEKARLMDIMMAQDFQDITGQIIKKVVGISQKLEQELAQLLRDNAPQVQHKEKPVDLMAGPAVPANAMAQDDVDDLLADLGF